MTNTQGPQRQMKRVRAVRHTARIAHLAIRGEISFERGKRLAAYELRGVENAPNCFGHLVF